MNREIKFRAWDTVNNKMIFTNEGDDYEFWDIVAFSSVQMVNKIFENKRYHFMQFTGLHDKNGVEIYEGDVLSGFIEYNYKIIEFKDGAFMYKLRDGSYENILFINDKHAFNGYILGNIYENPELLK